MNRWLLPCVCAALLLAGAPARGGSASIDFDLSGSEIGILGGLIQVPPDGSIDPASTLTVTFTADVAPGGGSGTVVAGPAVLSGLAVGGTFSKALSADALVSGSLDSAQLGDADGSLSGSLEALVVGDVTASVDATAGCTGALCEALGTFPLVVASVEVFPGGTLTLTGVNSPGAAEIRGSFFVAVGDAGATVSVVGVESARDYSVPEPAAPWMVAVGALALALRTASGRRSRRPA